MDLLLKVHLLYLLQSNELPSAELLNKFLSQNNVIAIPNLFFESKIDINNYKEINAFIQKVLNKCIFFQQYTADEKKWFSFYTLLRAYRSPTKDMEQIVSQYQELPVIETDNMSIKWVIYQTKTLMLSYYNALKLNPIDLILEIYNIPMDVVNLHY